VLAAAALLGSTSVGLLAVVATSGAQAAATPATGFAQPYAGTATGRPIFAKVDGNVTPFVLSSYGLFVNKAGSWRASRTPTHRRGR